MTVTFVVFDGNTWLAVGEVIDRDTVDTTAVKFAVTVLFVSIVTIHDPVPVHAPDHPVNVEPDPATAVRVTEVLFDIVYDSVQSLPQLIPVPEIVPEPVPDFVVVRVEVVGGGSVVS